MRQNPKLFVGFSENTIIKLALWKHCQITSIHDGIVSWNVESQQAENIEKLRQLLMTTGQVRIIAQASDQLRRQMNQAFFEKVLVDDAGVVKGTRLLQPLKTIKALQTQKHQTVATAAKPGTSIEPDSSFFGVNGSKAKYMVGLISQLLNDWSNKRLRELYGALQDKSHHRIRNSAPTHKPLRSVALLTLNIESLIADYTTGLGTKSLAVKYGISRPTVRLRLKKAGIVPHLPGSNKRE
jgi:hypothetical protein